MCQIYRDASQERVRLSAPAPAPFSGLRAGTQNRGQRSQTWSRVCTRGTQSKSGDTSTLDDDPWGIKDLKEYTTLIGEHTVETEVKRSKFIAHASPISSPEDALEFFELIKDPTASHNCYAYKIGNQYRFSDDGEPGGTAGKPILSAIEGSGLEGVAVLVVRFFGGTKLGAGGLVRAYGGAASIVLKEAPTKLVLPMVSVELRAEYSQLGVLYSVIDTHQATKVAEDYGSDGRVRLLLSVEACNVPAMAVAVRDATNGKVALSKVEDEDDDDDPPNGGDS